jgi:hypothetical protein
VSSVEGRGAGDEGRGSREEGEIVNSDQLSVNGEKKVSGFRMPSTESGVEGKRAMIHPSFLDAHPSSIDPRPSSPDTGNLKPSSDT